MKIDKEGYAIIRNSGIALLLILLCAYLLEFSPLALAWAIFSIFIWLMVVRFFRVPSRERRCDEDLVYSVADGTVVAIEKTYEEEYFKAERIQVSVFMSIWDVHANWFPIAGKVVYFKHHHGKFLVAWHPKSSTENERTTTVVENERGKIMFRQVAGLVAKRIVSYAVVGETVEQNSRVGFIKFGSRIDLFLPLDAEVEVEIGDKVIGTESVIAVLPKK